VILGPVLQIGTGNGKGDGAVGRDGHIALGIKHTVHGDGNACDLGGSGILLAAGAVVIDNIHAAADGGIRCVEGSVVGILQLIGGRITGKIAQGAGRRIVVVSTGAIRFKPP